MRNVVDYLIVAALGLVLAFMVVVPAVESVAQSLDNSANMIANAGAN
jgi:hypothetical protein